MNKLALTSLLIGSQLLGACKWTDFDDLEKAAWVHSTTKPDSNSSDWGIALAPGGSATDTNAGDRLIVLGSGQALYTELNYTPDGGADLAPGEVKLNSQFAIASLDPQPILVTDPVSHEFSLVVNSGGGSIAILSGVHVVNQRQIFNPKSSTPDAAAYVVAPLASGAQSALIVAAVDTVYGAPSTNAPPTQAACALTEADGVTPVAVRAIGGVRSQPGATTDNIVVWSTSGKLYVYDAKVFTADMAVCPGATAMAPGKATPLATVIDTGYQPSKGSQMLVLDDRYVILAGHHEQPDLVSSVMMFDMQAGAGLVPAMVGAPNTRPGQRSSTVLSVDSTHRFLVLGYPFDSVNGTSGGQVALYALTTAGIDANVAEQLSDAQPDTNELFGRAVTAFGFNGHQILAVSADNEVFAYYQTLQYGDTRTQ